MIDPEVVLILVLVEHTLGGIITAADVERIMS